MIDSGSTPVKGQPPNSAGRHPPLVQARQPFRRGTAPERLRQGAQHLLTVLHPPRVGGQPLVVGQVISAADLDEWEDAVAEYYELHPDEDPVDSPDMTS